ncbi:MAG: DUF4625 domain-containing protein [Marinilabilia sp.]
MKIFRMNALFRYFLTAFIAVTLIACGSDDGDDPKDNTPPEINISSPSDGATLYPDANDDLIVEGSLTDDVALSTGVISIEYTDSESSAVVKDDNTLKSTSSDEGDGTITGIDDDPWSPDPVELSLSGETHEFETGYKPFGSIPSDVKYGEYTLTIEVEDEAGNTASEEIILNFSGE